MVPLCAYLLQLGVNLFAWPPIFVGASRRRYAVADALGRALRLSTIQIASLLYYPLHLHSIRGSAGGAIGSAAEFINLPIRLLNIVYRA